MSRMFDAIFAVEERTRRAGAGTNGHAIRLTPPPGLVGPAEMAALYQAVRSLLGPGPAWVVQFVGPQGREGTSTVARGFAWAAAAQQAHVLLVDGRRLAGPGGAGGNGGRPEPLAVDITVEAGLSISTLGPAPHGPRAHCDHLRTQFSMVVVDSPGGVDSAESIAVAHDADGVVLVVEAERTRRPVVQRALARIADAGGRSLGVVLNRRRFHIPGCIYRRL